MRIYVKVIPRSSLNKVERILEGDYRVKITAPPIDGKANVMLIEILAKHFGVSKGAVKIVAGKTAKIKIVDISS